jgi:hypothetical protein
MRTSQCHEIQGPPYINSKLSCLNLSPSSLGSIPSLTSLNLFVLFFTYDAVLGLGISQLYRNTYQIGE